MGRKQNKYPGLGQRSNSPYWWINKTIEVHGRGKVVIRESTGQSDRQIAERIYLQRVQQETDRLIHGLRPEYKVEQGAAMLLQEDRRNIKDDVLHLDYLVKYLGKEPLHKLHPRHPDIQRFISDRQSAGCKCNTINRTLERLRRMLNLAATEWVDDQGLTWLAAAPKIKMLRNDDEVGGFPLTQGQERELLNRLPEHLKRMVVFSLNTGCRESEITGLKWEYERAIPDLGITVFDIPKTKNGRPKRVVLNAKAREVVEASREEHAEHVFTFNGHKVGKINNSAWKRARKEAGLNEVRGPRQHFRVHDLRHTFATRLREAGVPREDRKDLMGHATDDITTHYSAAETGTLLACVERLVEMNEKPSVYVVNAH